MLATPQQNDCLSLQGTSLQLLIATLPNPEELCLRIIQTVLAKHGFTETEHRLGIVTSFLQDTFEIGARLIETFGSNGRPAMIPMQIDGE
jgi:hypothetical protein